MKIAGQDWRPIWVIRPGEAVGIIDQTRLPFAFETIELTGLDAAARAIKTMQVRGAPLIGVTAAYGIALAMSADPSDAGLEHAAQVLAATRPTAVNLAWAIGAMRAVLAALPPGARAGVAWQAAGDMADNDVAINAAIGEHGLALIRAVTNHKSGPVNVLTHCNAGWLATCDWGTATAPIYKAHDAGIPLHVWVDETRPRSQGAHLTAWELGNHGVPHTVIADNAGGHLMQRGLVDLCLVGTDRVTAMGDVANKIGTYLKALAAAANRVPFYVCAPSPTIDWACRDAMSIPIEERSGAEVSHMTGPTAAGGMATIRVVAPGSAVANPAFDVTPARLVTGLVTERGVVRASEPALADLFPEFVGA